MSDREAILGNLPPSNGGTPARSPFQAPKGPPIQDLWRKFREALEPLGGRIIEVSDLEVLTGKQVRIDEDALPLVSGVPWLLTDDPWEAEAGITVAELAVAESGSLLLASKPGASRLTSLAPPLHVCLVRSQDIVPDLASAMDRLPGGNSVLISGPSRTADIEGVIVRGVHGPRELWVLIV